MMNKIQFKILALKQQLKNTDYQAIKYAEGLLTEEEYAPIKANRQAWRDEINRLEKDVLSEKPDVVTMLIGINDLWHPYDAGEEIDFDQIEKNYRYLVETIQNNGIRLLVMTPFLFPTNDHFIGLMDR